MNATRHKAILILALAGVLLFVLIRGVVIPYKIERAQRYEQEQQNPLTHHLSSILPYKNKYMGNASNLINLYGRLPLNGWEREFQLYPEQLKLQIQYRSSVDDPRRSEVEQALLYNSIAAFALIDNLQAIEYRFPTESYLMTRTEIQELFGDDLAGLLTQENWKSRVQDRLPDAAKTSPRFKQ